MNERYIDLESQHQEDLKNAEIEKTRAKVPPAGVVGPAKCSCGAPIPDRRRNAGYCSCVFCAELAEKRGL